MSEDKVTQLAPQRFKLAINGFTYNVHRVTPEYKTPVDAMLNRHYWAHVTNKLRVGDKIEAVPEDMTYIAELFVRDVGKLDAVVALIRHVEFDKSAGEEKDGYEIRWRGPKSKFGVVKDKDVLQEGFATRDDADTWLKNFLKKAA